MQFSIYLVKPNKTLEFQCGASNFTSANEALKVLQNQFPNSLFIVV